MPDDASAREYHSGDCVILPATRRLLREGAEVELEAKVFDLILLLVRDHARALGKQELIEKLWGRRPITDAALSQLIYKARRACGDDGERQSVIRTIYGRGLQWVAPVREVVVEPPAPDASPDSGDPPIRMPAAAAAAPRARRRLAWPIAAAIALIAIGVALAWWLVPRGVAHAAAGLPRLALLPIENATGDPSLDWTERGVPGLIGSLLDPSRGIDVADPLQVARAWNFAVPPGSSRIEHTRKVIGASILVTGTLRKLGSVYELSLHVANAHHNADVVLAGSEPGALAVSAVPRIRDALDLSPQSAPALAAAPVDPYLAQTFARGMDAGMHGRWSDAKPYLALCAKEAPGFLPCRLRLGEAQANSDQLGEAGKTLELLLAEARSRDDTSMVANALFQLAAVSLTRHEHATALQRLQEAAPLARKLGDPALQTRIALKSVDVASRLKRFDIADRELQLARQLIQRHALEDSKPDLHNSESFLASARGDYPAAEKADRDALAASTALGNETNAAGDAYNLGLDLLRQKKTADALPLLAYTYRMGGKLQNTRLEFSGGDNLAILLLNAGVDERVGPIAERLLAIGRQQKNPVWQALALILRGGSEWNAGARKAALASARQSAALVDPSQDPDLWIALQYNVAMAMVFEDPESLPAVSKQVDAVIAKQPRPADYRYSQSLVRAMAAAPRDQATAVRDLAAAAAAAHPGDPTHGDLHRAALVVALATGDVGAARAGLRDFDPSASHDADILLLASQWAQQQGDSTLAAKVAQRLEALRETALAALRKSGPDAIADIGAGPGH